jgi:hypothetical protein
VATALVVVDVVAAGIQIFRAEQKLCSRGKKGSYLRVRERKESGENFYVNRTFRLGKSERERAKKHFPKA